MLGMESAINDLYMISKIVDDWSVIDIYINNREKFACDTYYKPNFKSVNY